MILEIGEADESNAEKKQRNGKKGQMKRDRNKGEGWGDRWFQRWRRNAIKGNHPETPQSLQPCPSSKRPCVQQVTTALQLKVIRICHRVWFIITVLRVEVILIYSRRKSWTNHIWTGKKKKSSVRTTHQVRTSIICSLHNCVRTTHQVLTHPVHLKGRILLGFLYIWQKT